MSRWCLIRPDRLQAIATMHPPSLHHLRHQWQVLTNRVFTLDPNPFSSNSRPRWVSPIGSLLPAVRTNESKFFPLVPRNCLVALSLRHLLLSRLLTNPHRVTSRECTTAVVVVLRHPLPNLNINVTCRLTAPWNGPHRSTSIRPARTMAVCRIRAIIAWARVAKRSTLASTNSRPCPPGRPSSTR